MTLARCRGASVRQVIANAVKQRQLRVLAQVKDVLKRCAQAQARLRQPDRVDMSADEVFVGQIHAGRGDGAGDHQGRGV